MSGAQIWNLSSEGLNHSSVIELPIPKGAMSEFVRLEPPVIAEIVAICDTMLTELESSRARAKNLVFTHGFGDLESARQLAAGYNRKASGTPESARERIEQFIETLTQLRDAFAAGGEAFLDTQFDWARALDTLDTDA